MPTTPVVFLHAFPFNAALWSAERARLTDRIVLAPHFPGFGGRPTVGADLDRFAAAIIEDMDAGRIDRAVVVGLSMGGYVAFRLHARWPERITALVLADTRAGADSREGAAKRTEQAERVRREGMEWFVDVQLPSLLGETTRQMHPEVTDRVRRMMLDADPEGVALALLAMRDRPDSIPDLARIDVPVLAIVGEEDTVTPAREARLIAEGVSDGRLEIIPGAGHLSNLENPKAFGEALDSFLEHFP